MLFKSPYVTLLPVCDTLRNILRNVLGFVSIQQSIGAGVVTFFKISFLVLQKKTE